MDTDEGGNPDEGGDSSTPAADPYTVTSFFRPQDAEATFTPIEYELGTEQKVYDVSTGDLTAPEGYQFVEGQKASRLLLTAKAVNPEKYYILGGKNKHGFCRRRWFRGESFPDYECGAVQ